MISVLKHKSSDEALGRALSKLPPSEYTHVTRELSLEDAMVYLGKGAVTDLHENLDDHI